MTDAPMLWAFDLSQACTGIAFGRVGSRPDFASLEKREDDETRRITARLWTYLNELRSPLGTGKPAAIAAERPLEHGFTAEVDFEARTVKQRRGIQSAFKQKSLFDHVATFAELLSVPFYDVAPSTWRKHFLGDGKLPRNPAKLRAMAMCSVLNWSVENDDEAEAAGVFHWLELQVLPRQATVIHPGLYVKAATMAANRSPAIFANVSDEIPW